MDTTTKLRALANSFRRDRLDGYSPVDSITRNAEQLRELLSDASFWAIVMQILPIVLPLILTIVRELREGATLLEILVEHGAEIIDVVLAVIEALSASVDPAPGPIVPQ